MIDPYVEGKEAREYGVSVFDCPYYPQTWQYEEWTNGWYGLPRSFK